jgi:hypothetical protein
MGSVSPVSQKRQTSQMGGSPAGIDDDLRAAYLRRLGLDAEPPSVEALQRLHRRQVERIPYETMWIHSGEAWGITCADSAARVALEGRGGYCYHLNGALSLLLESLGYEVTRHVGGVHGPDGPDESSRANHLVLTVSGLPSSDNPSGSGTSTPASVTRCTRRSRSSPVPTRKVRSTSCSTRRRTALGAGT